VKYGDECWARILDCWDQWKEEGLTAHRNWWPDLYRNYCESRSIEPDSEILKFNISYRSTRADLKDIPSS